MRPGEKSILRRLGKVLHVGTEDITHEPLPQRWVELIHYLDEQERKRSNRSREGKN
jgi:hypothetical protein